MNGVLSQIFFDLCTASCSPTIDEDVDLKDFTERKVAVSFLLQKDVHVLSLDWSMASLSGPLEWDGI